MRTIEFRGWSEEQNKWEFGDYSCVWGKHFIGADGVTPNGDEAYYTELVAPESIGQFTGMTDGNGVKIFGAVRGEGGDLVKRYNAIFSVEYIGAEWVLKSIVKPDYCLTLALCDMSDIIIVGNAYEGVKK